MKLLSALFLILLINVRAIAETKACKDIPDIYSENLNLNCKSSTGRIFQRVFNEEINDFGWKDQTSSLVWYDTIKSIDSSYKTIEEVLSRCGNNGLQVPSKEQFDDAGINGLNDLFMRAKGWNQISYFYTSTYSEHGEVFIFSASRYQAYATVPIHGNSQGGIAFKPNQPIVAYWVANKLVCISK